MMYDGRKILLVLVIFLIAVTFPFWFSWVNEKSGFVPEPKLPEGEESCVESAEYMKALHMDLLNQWRNAVVRDGHRVYVSSLGNRYEMSLTGTCLGCHSNKAEFCDQCHDYVGAKPYCWDCHVDTSASQGEGK
jgi:hypothetical protein